MAKKMLGKVVAGAALGSASLLVFAPGVAYADGQPDTDEGKVFAKPHAVKAGEEVKLVQICEEPQEHPFVWSKVTGKVKLKPAEDRDSRGDHKGWGEENGATEHGADSEGWSGHERSQPAEAESGSGWGGGAADVRDDWKGEEHGQDAEGGRDSKDHDKKDWKSEDKKDWKGQDEASEWADEESTGGWSGRHENGADSAEHDWSGEGDWSGESDKGDWSGESDKGHWSGGSEEHSGESEWSGKRDWAADAADEHGKDDSWEHQKDFVYYGEARVARDAKPGTYKLEGSCGTGELVVLPHGGVDGGDGGIATGADRGLATAGAGLVGAAALGGLVLMRRRRADEFAA